MTEFTHGIFSATKNKTAKTEKIGNKVVESQTSLKNITILTSKLDSTTFFASKKTLFQLQRSHITIYMADFRKSVRLRIEFCRSLL